MSVGTALREAREQSGLSLAEVAERTRIRRTLIDNIENDDFHACGGDFYARGHIRSIAQAVGIDPAPLLQEFDGEHDTAEQAPTAAGVLLAERDGDATMRRPNWSAAMAAALVVVVAFGGYQLVQSDSGGGQPTVVAATDGADAPADPTDSATASDSPSVDSTDPDWEDLDVADDAIAQAPTDGVEVTLSAPDGRSWVSATGRGGAVLFEGLLEEGEERTFNDDASISLVMGNAGALQLLVNGEDVGKPGGNGEVVRATFGPADTDTSGG